MRPAVKRRTSSSIAIVDSVEVRFRAKGAKHLYRLATVLAGNDATRRARAMAQEYSSTYGDLEFAIFRSGLLIEKIASPGEEAPGVLKYAL